MQKPVLKIDVELELRMLQLEDAEGLFALTDKNRTYLKTWLPWLDKTQSAQDTKKFIESAEQI